MPYLVVVSVREADLAGFLKSPFSFPLQAPAAATKDKASSSLFGCSLNGQCIIVVLLSFREASKSSFALVWC